MNREVLYAINLTQTQYDQLPKTAEVRRMVVLCVERRAEYLAQPEAMNGGMNAFDRFPDYHAAVENLAALARPNRGVEIEAIHPNPKENER